MDHSLPILRTWYLSPRHRTSGAENVSPCASRGEVAPSKLQWSGTEQAATLIRKSTGMERGSHCERGVVAEAGGTASDHTEGTQGELSAAATSNAGMLVPLLRSDPLPSPLNAGLPTRGSTIHMRASPITLLGAELFGFTACVLVLGRMHLGASGVGILLLLCTGGILAHHLLRCGEGLGAVFVPR